MYHDKRVLSIIPARGGSKGLPGKNIKKLMGKPLIAYSIEQARDSQYIDRVIVSTEDTVIASVAEQYGAEVPFIRPVELSTDDSSVIDVLLHAIDRMEHNDHSPFDIIVLLHVTTPLRTVEDIDNSIRMLADENADNVFSVSEAKRNPYFNMVELSGDRVQLVKKGNFVTRQSAPQVFDMNASIYVWQRDVFIERKGLFLDNTKVYIMPPERSVDIDSSLEFDIAEMLLQKRQHR